MQKVKILGRAGELFLKEASFQYNDVMEAITAIDTNCKGFKTYILKNNYKMFYGPDDLSKLNTGNVKEQVIPVDNDPLNQIGHKDKVLYFIPSDFDGEGIEAAVVLAIIEIVLLVVSVVLQILLAPSPATQANEDESFEDKGKEPSYILNGIKNTTKEGGRIQLVYGTCLVGSMVLSTRINIKDE